MCDECKYEIDEEDKLAMQVKKAIKDAVNDLFEKECIDAGYYPIYVRMSGLSQGFTEKLWEKVLIDEEEYFCRFCDESTHYYDHDLHCHLCIDCYLKAQKERNNIR